MFHSSGGNVINRHKHPCMVGAWDITNSQCRELALRTCRWCPSGTSELFPLKTWELSLKHLHLVLSQIGKWDDSGLTKGHPPDLNSEVLVVMRLRGLTFLSWKWVKREQNHCTTMVLHRKFSTALPGSGVLGSTTVEVHSEIGGYTHIFLWKPLAHEWKFYNFVGALVVLAAIQSPLKLLICPWLSSFVLFCTLMF